VFWAQGIDSPGHDVLLLLARHRTDGCIDDRDDDVNPLRVRRRPDGCVDSGSRNILPSPRRRSVNCCLDGLLKISGLGHGLLLMSMP